MLSNDQRNFTLSSLHNKLSPVFTVKTKHGFILFYCPSTKAAWRVNTFHKKEPETLQWIDTFDNGDVFWDIGANVGTYSLYAAKRNIKTVAFEPASSNFYLLNKNIELNALNNKVITFCCGLDNESYIGQLLMSSTEPGNALSLSCSRSEKQELHIGAVDFPVSFVQGLATYSIDHLATSSHIDFPSHIKIDVDGIEVRILEGAQKNAQG